MQHNYCILARLPYVRQNSGCFVVSAGRFGRSANAPIQAGAHVLGMPSQSYKDQYQTRSAERRFYQIKHSNLASFLRCFSHGVQLASQGTYTSCRLSGPVQPASCTATRGLCNRKQIYLALPAQPADLCQRNIWTRPRPVPNAKNVWGGGRTTSDVSLAHVRWVGNVSSFASFCQYSTLELISLLLSCCTLIAATPGNRRSAARSSMTQIDV